MTSILTSKYLINKRDELSKEITKYWNIIKAENVVKKEFKRNYNIETLYEKIQMMAEERILIKLYLQCINMGITKLSDLPENNNYITIFTLREKKEILFHLGKIPTLDIKIKRKEGKKNMNHTEVFTSSFIAAQIKQLTIAANELEKKLDEFNNKAYLDISSPSKELAA